MIIVYIGLFILLIALHYYIKAFKYWMIEKKEYKDFVNELKELIK
jgi:hypothetical protein